MFKKILLATDLSKASEAVLSSVKGIKHWGVDEFILFYALGVRHVESLRSTLKNMAEPELQRQKKLIENQGLDIKLEIAPGIPSEEINKYAENKDISLIVMGSQGESAPDYQLFKIGGVTSEILHHHNKPLMVVRPEVTGKNGKESSGASYPDLSGKILFPTDFSDNSYRAFDYLKGIISRGKNRVTLFHIQDKSKIDKHLKDKLDEFNRIDGERLQMMKKTLQGNGSKEIDTKIVYGIPTREILEEAKKDYALIVMGSQGRGFIEEIFLGSVSHNVVRNAKKSVMLIPALR
ncbi:MAG: universal stress protein [Balneolales bacterium]